MNFKVLLNIITIIILSYHLIQKHILQKIKLKGDILGKRYMEKKRRITSINRK